MCSATGWIRFLNRDGSVRHEQRHRYRFSSWNTIYRSLLSLLDAGRYQLGAAVTGFGEQHGTVTVTLGPGEYASQRVECELLVCADGVARPPGRGCCPRSGRPTPGTWPGAAPCPSGTCPPAPGPGSATRSPTRCCRAATSSSIRSPHWTAQLTEGDRLINIVWYVNVGQGAPLDTLMTGRDGVRRPVSLPPGAATDAAVAAMRQSARDQLAGPIAEAVVSAAEPFVQVVYDIEVPRMVFGRICLIGDAAFAVRPHAAAGTAKAAADGWALAEELTAAGGDVRGALATWERRQLSLGRDLLTRCRQIGDSSQFLGTFRPGDPRLIFGLYGPGH